MAKTVEMEILHARLFLGSVEGFPQRVFTDGLSVAGKDHASAVKACQFLSLAVKLVQHFGKRRTDGNLLLRFGLVSGELDYLPFTLHLING